MSKSQFVHCLPIPSLLSLMAKHRMGIDVFKETRMESMAGKSGLHIILKFLLNSKVGNVAELQNDCLKCTPPNKEPTKQIGSVLYGAVIYVVLSPQTG